MKKLSKLVFGLTIILTVFHGDLAYGFPVLLGDDYTITVQFEGEQAQVVSPLQNWGVGEVYSSNDYSFSGTAFEFLWPYGSQGGFVNWRTFSSNMEVGLGTLQVPDCHASLRAQVYHESASYADFTISGLDGWIDYPSLTSLNNFQPDFDSLQTSHSYGLSNIVFTGTSISFRAFGWSESSTYEFNLGFRGELVPEPMTICLLGLGSLLLRKRKA